MPQPLFKLDYTQNKHQPNKLLKEQKKIKTNHGSNAY